MNWWIVRWPKYLNMDNDDYKIKRKRNIMKYKLNKIKSLEKPFSHQTPLFFHVTLIHCGQLFGMWKPPYWLFFFIYSVYKCVICCYVLWTWMNRTRTSFNVQKENYYLPLRQLSKLEVIVSERKTFSRLVFLFFLFLISINMLISLYFKRRTNI